MEMLLGLQSKTGALRELGNPYPAQKLEELMDELHQDSLEQGALDLQNAKLRMLIQMLTGIDPAADNVQALAQWARPAALIGRIENQPRLPGYRPGDEAA